MQNRMCWSPGCARRALYGLAGNRTGLQSCNKHRQGHEKLLVSSRRICSAINCSTLASFGALSPSSDHAGGKPCASRCAKHKDVGDVDLRNRHCEAQMNGWDVQNQRAASLRCPNRASFGNPAEGLRRFCSLHRGKWDENFNNKKTCASLGCSRVPSFCDPATRKATFCVSHRPHDFCHTSGLHSLNSNLKISNSFSWVPDHLWHRGNLKTALPYAQEIG